MKTIVFNTDDFIEETPSCVRFNGPTIHPSFPTIIVEERPDGTIVADEKDPTRPCPGRSLFSFLGVIYTEYPKHTWPLQQLLHWALTRYARKFKEHWPTKRPVWEHNLRQACINEGRNPDPYLNWGTQIYGKYPETPSNVLEWLIEFRELDCDPEQLRVIIERLPEELPLYLAERRLELLDLASFQALADLLPSAASPRLLTFLLPRKSPLLYAVAKDERFDKLLEKAERYGRLSLWFSDPTLDPFYEADTYESFCELLKTRFRDVGSELVPADPSLLPASDEIEIDIFPDFEAYLKDLEEEGLLLKSLSEGVPKWKETCFLFGVRRKDTELRIGYVGLKHDWTIAAKDVVPQSSWSYYEGKVKYRLRTMRSRIKLVTQLI
ncbi:MAG: hypothetical protein D6698_17355 [Gammaproteobacteria bacterium]|nr:MAG: hypothetical protein D6698_17355 [Gammaproteobacteria bacterium]